MVASELPCWLSRALCFFDVWLCLFSSEMCGGMLVHSFGLGASGFVREILKKPIVRRSLNSDDFAVPRNCFDGCWPKDRLGLQKCFVARSPQGSVMALQKNDIHGFSGQRLV